MTASRLPSTPTAAAPPQSRALANALRPVLLHINRHLRREISTLGVTAGQASMLATIAGNPGVGVAELAARESCSAPSVTGHLDRLEALGLVTRTRADSGDRRRVGVAVTAEGERVLRSVRSRRTSWLATRLDSLDPTDRAALEAAVGPLQRLVGEQ